MNPILGDNNQIKFVVNEGNVAFVVRDEQPTPVDATAKVVTESPDIQVVTNVPPGLETTN